MMLRLNLKIAWRSLLKHKAYTLTNIFGLAIGLTGFIFIVLFINYEKSYDKWSPKLERVYQLQEFSDYFSIDHNAHWISNMDLRLAEVPKALPQIEAVTVLAPEGRSDGLKIGNKPAFLQEGIRNIDNSFFKVMPYEFKYGNGETAVLKENSIILKDHLALKFFGDVNPVGKTINISGGSWSRDENYYTVTGVLKDTDTPSEVHFEALSYNGKDDFVDEWNYGPPAEIFVKTKPKTQISNLQEALQKAYLPVKDHHLAYHKSSLSKAKAEGNFPKIRLTELNEVHQEPLIGQSWSEMIKPVILLSVLLLLVSIINFVNLATAQASERAKEIGVKKVIGAYRSTLFIQFVTETFVQCIFATFLALLMVEISLPSINSALVLKLTLFNTSGLFLLLMQLFVIVLLITLLAGTYPALLLSGFKVSQIPKGDFSTGQTGAFVRKILVSIQFTISASFIIGILIVNHQLKYLSKRDNGFTASGLIRLRSGIGQDDYSEEIQKLKQVDGVQHVAFSSGVIGDLSSQAQSFKFKNTTKDLYGLATGIEGLQTLNARLVSGRFFSRNVVSDTINNVVLNESAEKLFGQPMLGQSLIAKDSIHLNVIGIVKDIQMEGFDQKVKPTIFVVLTKKWKQGVNYTIKETTLVRYDVNKTKSVIAGIDRIFSEMNTFYPANYTYVSEDLAGVLVRHRRFEKMIIIFSFSSVTLSLFGLFSLAAFITRQRTKEIAVRKVLGASHNDILLLLNKGYLWIILLSNSVAFPLSYILMNKWLSGFAYRIGISPMPFTIAFLTSTALAILTVSLQARKAVQRNPVEALKYE